MLILRRPPTLIGRLEDRSADSSDSDDGGMDMGEFPVPSWNNGNGTSGASGNLTSGATAGIAIGTIVGFSALIGVIAGIVLWRRRRRRLEMGAQSVYPSMGWKNEAGERKGSGGSSRMPMLAGAEGPGRASGGSGGSGGTLGIPSLPNEKGWWRRWSIRRPSVMSSGGEEELAMEDARRQHPMDTDSQRFGKLEEDDSVYSVQVDPFSHRTPETFPNRNSEVTLSPRSNISLGGPTQAHADLSRAINPSPTSTAMLERMGKIGDQPQSPFSSRDHASSPP